MKVKLNIESGLTDSVAERFDAGVRRWERLEQDMIAMRISPSPRMATVGSPAYSAQHGKPSYPEDLTSHVCINLRMVDGSIYPWEYEKSGRRPNVKLKGQLILNDIGIILEAAAAGHGTADVLGDRATPLVADGRLVRVLDDCCEPFDGHYLHYPSRRQPSATFTIFLDALHYRIR